MAQGKYIIGLNEVPVGIIVPNSIFEIYAFWIGKRKAYQNLLEGKLMGADEALSIGLIDEVAPIESLMTVALNKMKTYISFDSTTWQESKLNLRQDLIASLSVDQTPSLEKMLKQWWAPSTRSVLNTIIKNLQAKKK
jgi:enoyl-CoA hydratase/carnithine racemase